jgi:hypothetical protein
MNIYFQLSWNIISRPYNNTVFHFLRKCLFSTVAITISDLQDKRVSISPHPHQQLLFSVILIITILVAVKWYLIVFLISISLMSNDVFFHMYIDHLYVFSGDISSQFI